MTLGIDAAFGLLCLAVLPFLTQRKESTPSTAATEPGAAAEPANA